MMPGVILLSILASPSMAAPAVPCAGVTQRRFEHLSDLPRGAAQAMGMAMAEKGRPFQSSDAISEPTLPRARFVSAVQQACTLRIDYEQGGIAHRWATRTLTFGRLGWTRAPGVDLLRRSAR